MRPLEENCLDALDTDQLYKLLGEAWYRQLVPQPGEVYFLERSDAIGRREFRAIKMRTGDLTSHQGNTLGYLTAALKDHSWPAPASVVAALTARGAK